MNCRILSRILSSRWQKSANCRVASTTNRCHRHLCNRSRPSEPTCPAHRSTSCPCPDTSKQIAFFQSAAGDGGKPFALNLAVAAAFEGALSRGRHVDESKNCSAGNRLGEWGSADGHPLLRCESMAAHSYAWRRRGHLGSALGLRGAPRSSPAGPFAAGGSSSRCSRSGTTPPTCARSARACSGSTRPTTRGGAQSRKSASLRRAAERAAERAVGWPSPAARRAPVRCRINSAFREKAERPARSGSRSPTARPRVSGSRPRTVSRKVQTR